MGAFIRSDVTGFLGMGWLAIHCLVGGIHVVCSWSRLDWMRWVSLWFGLLGSWFGSRTIHPPFVKESSLARDHFPVRVTLFGSQSPPPTGGILRLCHRVLIRASSPNTIRTWSYDKVRELLYTITPISPPSPPITPYHPTITPSTCPLATSRRGSRDLHALHELRPSSHPSTQPQVPPSM